MLPGVAPLSQVGWAPWLRRSVCWCPAAASAHPLGRGIAGCLTVCELEVPLCVFGFRCGSVVSVGFWLPGVAPPLQNTPCPIVVVHRKRRIPFSKTATVFTSARFFAVSVRYFSAIFGWCDLHGFISTWLLHLGFASLSVGTVGGGVVLLVSETTSSEVASVWCRHSALGRVCPGSTWPPPVGVCSWVLACAIVSSSTVYHFSHLPPRPCGDTGVGFLQAITTRRRFPAQPPRCVGFSCVYHCYGMGGRLQLV